MPSLISLVGVYVFCSVWIPNVFWSLGHKLIWQQKHHGLQKYREISDVFFT